MSRHLRSAPRGLALVGWPRLLTAGAVLWLAPVTLGVAAQGLAFLLPPEPALMLAVSGMALVASPLFSWTGWLAALPLSALALHLGWFGWMVAALVGAFSGWLAGEAVGTDLGGGFGLVSVLALRLVLGRLVPAAFDPGPGR